MQIGLNRAGSRMAENNRNITEKDLCQVINQKDTGGHDILAAGHKFSKWKIYSKQPLF